MALPTTWRCCAQAAGTRSGSARHQDSRCAAATWSGWSPALAEGTGIPGNANPCSFLRTCTTKSSPGGKQQRSMESRPAVPVAGRRRPGHHQAAPRQRSWANDEVGCGCMQADAPAAARLAIAGLHVRFGARQVVSVDELSLGEAEIVGLAGESGSGKSMTTLAVLGLAHTVGATVSGSIKLNGTELTTMSQREMLGVRGRRIAAIFQSPSMAFSPVFRVGAVVLGALRLHGMSKGEAK